MRPDRRRPARGAVPATAPRAVLVVDDEQRLRELVCRMLVLAGYEATAAGSAGDALALLAERCYELVLSDYAMPGGDGLTLLMRLRAVDRDLPFVLWSSAMPAVVRQRAGELGAATHAKTVGRELTAIVDRALARSGPRQPVEA